MKYILSILLLFFATNLIAQPVVNRIYADTVIISKRDTSNAEFILKNATRNVTGGVLTNIGKGRTAFVLPSPSITLSNFSATSPLSYNNSTGNFSIPKSSISQDGYLGADDWNNFNSKPDGVTFSPNSGGDVTGGIGASGTNPIVLSPTLTIGASKVTTTKIASLAVTNAKINDVSWSKITGTPTTLSGYGITDALSSSTAGTTYFPLGGGSLTGTGGSGFIGLISQSAAPSTPSSGVRIYANSIGAFSWINSSGYRRSFGNPSALSDLDFTLPNSSGTLALTSDVPTAANPTGTIGLSATNGTATTFMRSDAAPALSQSITPTWTGFHTFGRSATASGAIARGTYFNQTLTAAANNDVLVNLDINSTFTNGAFTGVANLDLRTSRWANFGTTNNTGIVIGSTGWSGGVPLSGLKISLNGGTGEASYNNSSGGGFYHNFYTSATSRFQIRDSYTSVVSGSFLVGTQTTVSSAAAVINSTTQGFLPPRMTESQRTSISSPAVGLMVYQTNGTEGVYVYTSTGWKILSML